MKPRENPCNTERLGSIQYQFIESSWDALFERLQKLRFRAAIVGSEGSGKTTLLEELGSQLRQRGYSIRSIRLSRSERYSSLNLLHTVRNAVHNKSLILLDGADLLPNYIWMLIRHLSRKAQGLIITSHQRNLLPTLIECQTTFPLLLDILTNQVGIDCRQHGELLNTLFIKHNGNIRDVLRGMYDWFAMHS